MTDIRPAVSDLSREQLVAWLGKHGEPVYRAKQIRRHATHGTEGGFEDLTDLPKTLRDALAHSFRWSWVEPVREEASADGETRKALLELRDGHHIESVLMPHHGARNAVCVSTQAGCPMACRADSRSPYPDSPSTSTAATATGRTGPPGTAYAAMLSRDAERFVHEALACWDWSCHRSRCRRTTRTRRCASERHAGRYRRRV